MGIESIELKELSQEELGGLAALISKIGGLFSRDPSIVNDGNYFLPRKIEPVPSISDRRCGIVVVALGGAGVEPKLSFLGRTLLGYYAIDFFVCWPGKDVAVPAPYNTHSKPGVQVHVDRVIVFPPFRGNGISRMLQSSMEEALRSHGYGNIECRPAEEFLKGSLEKQGYERADPGFCDGRWGKRL